MQKNNGLLTKATRRVVNAFLGKNTRKKLIKALSWDMDLIHHIAHPDMGIGKYQTDELSGEAYVLNTVLREKFGNREDLVFFDAGANVGNYSAKLHKAFPQAQIYAFEPHPKTFEKLQQKLGSIQNVHLFNLGLNSEAGTTQLTSMSESGSSHDSIYAGVANLEKRGTQLTIDISLATIDEIAQEYTISSIDFLKIDTEGNELNILKGAEKQLERHNIKVIQFEFNSMNVYSRVFLRDFYELLTDFSIYRLDSESLIHLPEYDVRNEIFRFQNFLAIHHSI